ncbi:uncharacterized protein LACBIDRAFT_335031, partial [Laccaria bicolor S238N-H82]
CKFELDSLEQAYRKTTTNKSQIKRKEPGIQKLAKKYNDICAELEKMIKRKEIPHGACAPHRIATDGLFKLDVDDDIWQDVGLDDMDLCSGREIPQWLGDEGVQKGIKSLMELDRCQKELRRLSYERSAMQEWFEEEWKCVMMAMEIEELALAQNWESSEMTMENEIDGKEEDESDDDEDQEDDACEKIDYCSLISLFCLQKHPRYFSVLLLFSESIFWKEFIVHKFTIKTQEKEEGRQGEKKRRRGRKEEKEKNNKELGELLSVKDGNTGVGGIRCNLREKKRKIKALCQLDGNTDVVGVCNLREKRKIKALCQFDGNTDMWVGYADKVQLEIPELK